MNIIERIGYREEDLLMGLRISIQASEYTVMVLRKKGDELERLEEKHFRQRDTFLEYLDKHPGVPLVIALDEPCVAQYFPPGKRGEVQDVMKVQLNNPKEFMLQRLPAKDGGSWVGVARKTAFQEVAIFLQHHMNRVIYVSFFPALIGYILPGWGDYQEKQLYLLDDTYSWQGGLIGGSNSYDKAKSISRASLAYHLDLKEEDLLLFASLVHYHFSKGNDLDGLAQISDQKTGIISRMRQIRIMVQVAFTLLLGLLIGEGISFYQDFQLEDGKSIITQNQASLNLLSENERLIGQKISFLNSIGQGSLKTSRIAYYLDVIGQETPQGIQYREVLFQPNERERKKWVRNLTSPIDLLIRGEAKQAGEINQLSRRLIEDRLVRSVEVYETSYEAQQQLHLFTLTLVFEDE